MHPHIDIGHVTISVKLKRTLWNVCALLLFRPFGTKLFRPWRLLLLRLFGAKIDGGTEVYRSARIWVPWNLTMKRGACLGPDTICYNQAMVTMEENVTVSQYSYLCTAGHATDLANSKDTGLIIAPITLHRDAWVGTRAFIGMGVVVGEGAIVGATASVFKDVPPYTIVGGNPAKEIKKRVMKEPLSPAGNSN